MDFDLELIPISARDSGGGERPDEDLPEVARECRVDPLLARGELRRVRVGWGLEGDGRMFWCRIWGDTGKGLRREARTNG